MTYCTVYCIAMPMANDVANLHHSIQDILEDLILSPVSCANTNHPRRATTINYTAMHEG
jgi:hypothetical protein